MPFEQGSPDSAPESGESVAPGFHPELVSGSSIKKNNNNDLERLLRI
jgi:hypothetical protein